MLKINENLIQKTVAYLVVIIVCLNIVSCRWFGEEVPDVRSFEVTVLNRSNEVVYICYGQNGDYFCSPYVRLAPGESYIQDASIDMQNKKEWTCQWKILKKTTFDKYAGEVIIGEDIFDDRIVFNYKRLKRLDFKITYP